jgi:uncharacterized integral membrane protein
MISIHIMIQKIIYILVFIALFLLGLRNAAPTNIDLYFARFNTPLIVALFALFILGIFIGIISMLPKIYRQSSALKAANKAIKEFQNKQDQQEQQNKINADQKPASAFEKTIDALNNNNAI